MSCLGLALLILSASPDPQRIEDPVRGYSFQLPAEFVELPGFQKPPPTLRTGTLGTWVRGLDRDDFVIVSLEGMGGAIARGPADLTDRRPGASQLHEKWKGFDVDGLRLLEPQQGRAVVILAVQVPLSPDAVQVMSSGLAENEPAVREALLGVLATLEGRSTWLTDEERVSAGLEGAARLGVTFLLVAGAAFGVWRWARRKREE